MNENLNKSVVEILKKQCKMVNADFNSVDFENDLWFFEHQWTKDQESEFVDWMTEYLYNSKQARLDLMKVMLKDKATCKRAAEEFAFNYGWKYKLV